MSRVYRVMYDGTVWYVEAPSFAAAVELWTAEVRELWGEDYQESDQPDSVEHCGDGPVIRNDRAVGALTSCVRSAASIVSILANIADAYDANDLDDEARKRWGPNLEHENDRRPDQIELYQGRGGNCLLTLMDCMAARDVLLACNEIVPPARPRKGVAP